MKHLIAIDTYIIEAVQTSYLWLWDRAGVYVATLIFAAGVLDHLCLGPMGLFSFFVLAIFGAFSGARYWAQESDLRFLNSLQRSWQEFRWRLVGTLLVATFFTLNLLQLKLWAASSDVFFLLWNYLACVQVRDREPKEFFPSLKPVGVGA